MCGRYSQTAGLEQLARRFGVTVGEPTATARYNIAPGQRAPVVVGGPSRQLAMPRWGFIPHWAPPTAGAGRRHTGWINARAETVADKPSFAGPLRQRRCLVIADGFYEWRRVGGRRATLPYRITLTSREPFAFAGLWDRWQQPNGTVLDTFAIVTTTANDVLRPIHDRMPVILQPEDEAVWLDLESRDLRAVTALLRSPVLEDLSAYEVSALVNSPANDRPECLRPVSA
jgi:putative SOS response-associated peptidase YedK